MCGINPIAIPKGTPPAGISAREWMDQFVGKPYAKLSIILLVNAWSTAGSCCRSHTFFGFSFLLLLFSDFHSTPPGCLELQWDRYNTPTHITEEVVAGVTPSLAFHFCSCSCIEIPESVSARAGNHFPPPQHTTAQKRNTTHHNTHARHTAQSHTHHNTHKH